MNVKKNVGFLVIAIAVVAGGYLFLSKEKKETSQTGGEKLSVVTTLFPLYDFAKEIGGDRVSVTLLLPPGVEAHGFEPKPSDMVKINASDMFVYTGKFMEPWAEDIIKGMAEKIVRVVDASAGVEMMQESSEEDAQHSEVSDKNAEHFLKDESRSDVEAVATEPAESGHHHHHEGVDPHIWLGLDNAKKMVENIGEGMAEKDPENAAEYKKRVIAYNQKLDALDTRYKTGLASCRSRDIVYGGHYAFGYLASRYNLSYVSAQGFSPDAEPTAKDLALLVKQVQGGTMKTVFYEELASPKIAETIANETGAKLLLLNGAHNVTKEDLQNGVTFLEIMERNLENLRVGLDCV